MKLHLKHHFILFLLIASVQSIGQTQDVKFTLVTGSNGISLGKINGMTRDRNGMMWFSDQSNSSIVSYDGSRMTKYQNDPKKQNSLGGFYPECLYADSSGLIWIGFYGTGLDKFEPETNTFIHYRHDPKDPASLSNDTVTALLIDHLGNFWIGSYGGIDLLDRATGKFKHYGHTAESSSLSSRMVRAIYEDHQGSLWIGTGLVWDADSTDGGLNRYNRSTGTFTRYMHDPNNPHSLIDNKVRAIFEDSKGNFWVGTKGDGLHSMDRATGLFERHLYDPSQPEKLARPPLKTFDDHITFITEDTKQHLWVGTLANGIIRYDLATKKIVHYGNNADRSGNFNDNSSWFAYTSTDGLFWISTQETYLYKIDLFTNNLPKYPFLAGVPTYFFYEESNSAIWYSMVDGGLLRQDRKTGETKKFMNDPKNDRSISNNSVNQIMKDKQDNLWVGTRDGLNRLDLQTNLFTRYLSVLKDSTTLTNNHIIDVCDDGNLIWVSTDGGLNKMDKSTGKCTRYVNSPGDTTSLSNDIVVSLLKEEKNFLWLSTWNNGGVDKLNIATGKFKRYIQGQSVGQLYVDVAGVLWVRAAGGLYFYDRQRDDFYPLSSKLGVSLENVDNMVADKENNLWLASRAGIYRINKERTHAILFGKESGIISEEMGSWITRMNDGKIYVPGYYRDYLFDPATINISTATSNIFFSGLWLNGKEIKSGADAPFHESLLTAKEIDLPYNENVFSIGFTSVDYSNSNDKKVYYRLDNYDNDWRQSNADNRVYYFNVPPGKYTFYIKAVNTSSGSVAEKKIIINIAAPWWTRWWAYTFYGIVVVLLALSIYRYQRKRLLKKERERTRAIELAQAKEIEKAYHELKTTQQQLVQAEKMASLGELTAGIAHEIQNPLNFVNNFSEVNKELITEMNEEIEKGNYSEARSIGKNVSDNQNKIIFHGKRADSIVKGMLQHSRNSRGIKEATDINALTDEYLRLAYHGFRAKEKEFNATLKTDFDETIGKINIIPQDIGRVILNLINNAFYAVAEKKKSRPAGYEPTVSITTKKIADKIEIRISDNGSGIPENIIDKIFQPFYTTKPTGQGTGLGLSLSYDIVKAHGGELSVVRGEREGTEFVIQM